MPMSSLAVWRRRRFPSLFAAMAMVAVVAACDSSTGTDNDVAQVAVNPPTPTLNIGQTQQLVATATTSGGRIVNATTTWATSAASVATVDGNGLVTAVGGGSATITATAGGESSDATVTVWFPTQSVVIAPAAGQLQTIRQEGATQLAATITDTQGAVNPARQLVWTSSDTDVATVSSSGRVSARGIDGSTTITATTTDGVAGTFVVDVSGTPEVATVTLSPTSSVIGLGQTVQLTVTARAASGTIIPGLPTIWASSSASASVSGTGLVTGDALGTANITADVEGVVATAPFTVLANLPAGANALPNVADGAFTDYALHLPAGTTSFTIETDAASGDTDLYVFAPGVTPGPFAGSTFSGWTCRPWAVGPAETCTINAPVAGVYRIRFHAFPGEGGVTSLTADVTIVP